MAGQLALRFLLGGVIVSLFAVTGELFKPKTFAGIFGAAPSVALATLAITYATRGGGYAAVEGRSMLIGSAALLVYSAACVATVRRRGIPVWLGAVVAWGAWAVVALGVWRVLQGAGFLA